MTAHAPLEIRRATGDDLAHLVRLEAAAFGDPWPAALLAGEIAHPAALILVAPAPATAAAGDPQKAALVPAAQPPLTAAGGDPEAGPLHAYACFRQVADEAELLRVAVHPAVRGHGLARRLIAAGLPLLRTAGVNRCHLEVRPGNGPALAVYRALGFELAGRRRSYYRDGSDALLFTLDL